jgi:hypothetical protein
MNNPIVTLKNRFILRNDKFWEISDKVLNLRTTINVIIYDTIVYFLDMSGETLFNMERAYKIKCNETIEVIEKMDIVSDITVFKILLQLAKILENLQHLANQNWTSFLRKKIEKKRQSILKFLLLVMIVNLTRVKKKMQII